MTEEYLLLTGTIKTSIKHMVCNRNSGSLLDLISNFNVKETRSLLQLTGEWQRGKCVEVLLEA